MVKASLLPLTKTVLVSSNFPAGRTTIGHVVRDGDYVIVAHKERCFIGRLIGAPAYEARGFDPFAAVAELPTADSALRAAVSWGEALAGTAVLVAGTGGEATLGDVEALWRAPTDTLAIALARALFLAGTIGQRRTTYFSLSLHDLPYRRSVLTRFVDDGGQPPPAALLAGARALPEAGAEALTIEFALSHEAPLEQREQNEPGRQVWTSVRKPVPPVPLPTLSIPRSGTPLQQRAVIAAAEPQTPEGTMPPPLDISPPMAEALSPGRSPRFSAGPWWLAPVMTAAVALLSVAWIWNESRLLGDIRSDAVAAAKAAKAAQAEVQRLTAEAAGSAAAAAEAAKNAAGSRVAAANDAALSTAALAEVQRLADETARSAAAAAEAAKNAAGSGAAAAEAARNAGGKGVAAANDAALAKAALAEVQRLAADAAKSAAAAAEAARSATAPGSQRAGKPTVQSGER